MKTLLLTPIIFALIGWTQVSAQDSSDPITLPANELVTFSSSLNVTQCEGNDMSSSCSTSMPLISNQSLLLTMRIPCTRVRY